MHPGAGTLCIVCLGVYRNYFYRATWHFTLRCIAATVPAVSPSMRLNIEH